MKKIASSMLAAAFALALPLAGPALGQEEFRIMAPAGPGGGYDQTARSMQQVLMELGLAKDVQVYNVPGAGGTIGLAQFVSKNKGNPGAMMMSADTMIGATVTNNSPVGIDAVTPLARLTSDYHIIVVPTSSGLKTMEDLVVMLKNDPGKVSWAGGSAGGSASDDILDGSGDGGVGILPKLPEASAASVAGSVGMIPKLTTPSAVGEAGWPRHPSARTRLELEGISLP